MATPASNKNIMMLVVGLVALLVVAGAYILMTQPDRRSTTDRLGDAIHELPNGVDAAGRQLGDRTPAERLGDKVKDLAK